MQTIKPEGKSCFREAYNYGLGMLLNFHFNYMARAMGGKDVVQIPQYLHIVLASEDQDRIPGLSSRLDNFVLQESFLEEMNKGV